MAAGTNREHGGVDKEMNTSSLTILNNLLAASHCMSRHRVKCDWDVTLRRVIYNAIQIGKCIVKY